MTHERERMMLQGFIAGVAALAAAISVLVFIFGTDAARWLFDIEFVQVDNFAELDSSLRFFGAIFLSAAVLLVWSIPRVESSGAVLRIVAGGFVLGAIGRLISAADEGWPNTVATTLLALELSVIAVPLWQWRVVKTAEDRQQSPS